MESKKNDPQLPLQGPFLDTSQNERSVSASNDNVRDQLFLTLMALESIKGVGFRTLRAMYKAGWLQNCLEMDSGEISSKWASLGSKHKFDLGKVVNSTRKALIKTGKLAVDELEKKGIIFLPDTHKDYPESLKRLHDPPSWIFVIGKTEVLHSQAIAAVIGTRQATLDGQRLAYLCAGQLARKNVVVLSGLAKGIDEKAHLGATDYYGTSIAVLGHGISTPGALYDQYLRQRILDTGGAIISEYLPTDPPSRQSFLRRNELQVALSKVVIPIECPSLESGTGATIRRAQAINTPVIGVIQTSKKINAAVLSGTKDNLTKIGVKTYNLHDDNSIEFWGALKSMMPDHDWTSDATQRQERFFAEIANTIHRSADRLQLTKESIDKLAEQLKKLLTEK